jgi:DNA-binding transcriptional ArsR family regulator
MAEVRTRPMRVAHAPIMTLFLLIVDALRPDADRGLSRELRGAIQATFTPQVRSALAPLAAPYHRWPDCIAPRPDPGARSVDDVLEELADTPADTLLRDLAAERLDDLEEWQPAARNPRTWVLVYTESLRRVWEVVGPTWSRGAQRLEQEAERVETAAARGAQPELLAGLFPPAPVRDDALLLPGVLPRHLRIPRAGLVVIPMLAGPEACARYHDANANLTHFAYPIPEAHELERAVSPDSELDALLGRPRASILRELDRPATPGELARTISAVPSAVTHHLHALERAGLVVRHREGRHVIVDRTARGSTLLALFEL